MLKPRTVQAVVAVAIVMAVLTFQNCGGKFESIQVSSVSKLDGMQGSESIQPVQISCPIENGDGVMATQSDGSAVCRVVTCHQGFRNEGNLCLPSTSSCPILNGNGVLQPDGLCLIGSCNAGFHPEANRCDPDLKPCAVPNGVGEQEWMGALYGVCRAVSCNTGYQVQGGECLASAPKPSPETPMGLPQHFSFKRGEPISLKLAYASPLASNTRVTLAVTKVLSRDLVNARLYTRGSLTLGSTLVASAAAGDISTTFHIATVNRPLKDKTVFELEVRGQSALLPQKVTVTIEPQPDDIVDVHESRRGASGPNGCFALTYSGVLKTNESEVGTEGFCPLNGKVEANWKILNSTPESKISRFHGLVLHYVYAFAERLANGEEVLRTRYWAGRTLLTVRPIEQNQYRVPFIDFHQGNYGLAAVHPDLFYFYYGITAQEAARSDSDSPRIFGQVRYDSPVGALSKVIAFYSGNRLLAIDLDKKAHILEIVNYGVPSSVRLLRTMSLGGRVIDVTTSHTFAVLLTSNKRVFVQLIDPRTQTRAHGLIAPGVIELPADKTPVSVSIFLSRISVSYDDGTIGFYEVPYEGIVTATGRFASNYLGTTSAHGIPVQGPDLFYNSVTNTFSKPVLRAQ